MRQKGFTMYRRTAFTLIELLVVISIIALLMGILLPTLQRARKQTNRAFCANNIRQVLIALTMYADEHEGSFFPRHNVGGAGYWLWGLDKDAAQYIVQTGATKETFFCPSNKQQQKFREEYWDYMPHEHIIGYFCLWDNPPPDDRGWQPQGSGNKKFPVRITSDSAGDTEVTTDVTFSDERSYKPPEYPNGNFAQCTGGMWSRYQCYDSTSHLVSQKECYGTNVGLVDGHVEWRPFNEMERRSLDGMYPTHWW
jgi:prepilin-type N-terminal cleavage/methylation domain-containing protein/prepilin-type processing-associated H-X9-DG protein